jgi:chromosome segregation ATPase
MQKTGTIRAAAPGAQRPGRSVSRTVHPLPDMKTRHLLASAALLIPALATVGCASFSRSPGHLRGQTTSDSITTAANEIENARRQLADTSNALGALVNQPTFDLPAAFERYRSSVTAMERTVGAVNSEAENMQKQGQRYFEHWNSQLAAMQNEDIRARSATRQQEVTRQFTEIQQQYQEARQQLPVLMAHLRDIQKLLSADLTPAGIASAREFAGRAENEALRVRQTLDRLAESFRSVSGVIAPQG